MIMERKRFMKCLLLVPFRSLIKPRYLVALAWISSLLLVYTCCRLVTDKVYIDIERALVQPKESPPLLGYLLLQRFYSPVTAQDNAAPRQLPLVTPSIRVTYDEIEAKLKPANAPPPRCHNFKTHDDIPALNSSSRIPYTTICAHSKDPALLTLVTTMYDRKDKMFIFNNTVNNWPKLEGVKPVLFITPENETSPMMIRLLVSACNQGWDVLVAPHCNEDTYPVLRSMWQIGLMNYKSFFYGYTNGDILFDKTLQLTLSHLVTQDPHIFKRKHLISGQRHNIYIPNNTVISTPSDINTLLYNASLHTGIAIDYFFTTRHGFPWHDIPPFVIGRPQFDNWLIWNSSLDSSVMDIDASETILAMHQGLQGTIASWSETNVSVKFNNNIAKLSPGFSVLHGCTYCMNYRLMNTVTSILVVPRQMERRKYTCTVDAEEHIAFLQMRTDEALLTAYSKTVLTLDANIILSIKKALGDKKSKL